MVSTGDESAGLSGGRNPPKYASNAERQRAYRQRMSEEKKKQVRMKDCTDKANARANMSLEEKQSGTIKNSVIKRATRANRSKEQIDADNDKVATRMK